MVKQAGQPASTFLPWRKAMAPQKAVSKVLKLPSKLLLQSLQPPSTCNPTSPHDCAPLLTYHHGNLTSPSMFPQPSHQQPEKICLFTPVLSWTHFWKWITFLPWASVSQSVKWEDRRKLPKPEILTVWGLSGIENVWQEVVGFQVLFPERII